VRRILSIFILQADGSMGAGEEMGIRQTLRLSQ
jgi:hypothetical protein